MRRLHVVCCVPSAHCGSKTHIKSTSTYCDGSNRISGAGNIPYSSHQPRQLT
jgi:hypothetical protein